MKKQKKERRKWLSLMVSLAMVFTAMPQTALGEIPAGNTKTGGLCEHHPVHTEECGYREAETATDSNAGETGGAACTFLCSVCNGTAAEPEKPKPVSRRARRAGESDEKVLHISEGDIVITEDGYQIGDDTKETYKGLYRIEMGGGGETENTIWVKSGTHTITLDGMRIERAPSGKPPMEIAPDASVTLCLEGDNILKGDSTAGICVPAGASLTIQGDEGRLEATGDGGGAGIGGDSSEPAGGEIEIKGGTIVATSGINGDRDQCGAGIGGGAGGAGGTITISGGTVKATAEGGGAGIGGGGQGSGSAGTITISGGTVTAKSERGGAGIGNGSGFNESSTGGPGTITISEEEEGTTKVEASSQDSAGIGGKNCQVTINGGNVTAKGEDGIYVDNPSNKSALEISGGRVTTEGRKDGIFAKRGKIVIDGGTVTATGESHGIFVEENGCGIKIKGATVTATATGDAGIRVTGISDVTLETSGGEDTILYVSTINCGGGSINTGAWNGIVFLKSGEDPDYEWMGRVYCGNSGTIYSLKNDFILESDCFLEIPEGKTLTILEGKTLRNEGKIRKSGNIDIKGTLTNLGVIEPYTVTFNSQGGSEVASASVLHGKTVTEPTAPTLAWHTFGGWYTDEDYGTEWDFTNNTVTGDMTLYAKWTLNTYTVTFDSNGGTAVASASVSHEGFVSEPSAPSREGYTFTGWYKDEALNTSWDFSKDKVTEDVTLYAGWTKNQYTVTFDSQGGSEVPSASVSYGDLVPEPIAPSREGYTFTGWFKDEALNTSWDFSNDTVTGDTTLYAGWTKNQYTVTFDSKGGSEVAAASVSYEGLVPEPTAPSREGYSFTGWFKDEALSQPWSFSADTVTGDVTLYAGWTKNQYTVTFASNGGTAVSPEVVSHGEALSEPTAPSREGYTFTGWFKDEALSQPWSFSEDKVTGNTTLYAGWTKKPDGGNGGENEEKPVPPEGGNGDKPAPPEGGNGDKPAPPEGGNGDKPAPPEGGNGDKPAPPEGGNGDKPGGNGSGDSDSSDSQDSGTASGGGTTSGPGPVKDMEAPTVTPGTDGSFSLDKIFDILDKAEDGNLSISVPLENDRQTGNVSVVLPGKVLDALTKNPVQDLSIHPSGLPSLSISRDSFQELKALAEGGELVLRLEKTGEASFYQTTLFRRKDGLDTELSDWKGMRIGMKLPYEAKAGEPSGLLWGMQKTAEGNAEWLRFSAYEASEAALYLEADRPGIYGVGCDTLSGGISGVGSETPFGGISGMGSDILSWPLADGKGHWAETSILFAVSRGLLPVSEDGRFEPEAGLSRGTFGAALKRLTGTEVPMENPDAPPLREDLAVLLCHWFRLSGRELPKLRPYHEFADSGEISMAAAKAVADVQRAALMAGKDGNRFAPREAVTKAQAAAVLNRLPAVCAGKKAADGWSRNDSGSWMFHQEGKPATGWILSGGQWYWLKEDGTWEEEN